MPDPTTDPGLAPPFEHEREEARVTEEAGDLPDLVSVPYEPSTNNEEFNRLLNMLSPPANAPAIQSRTTDGELAAHYDAADVRPPRRSPTPLPEARVLLNCTGDVAPHREDVPRAVAGRSTPPPFDARGEDPSRTITIVRTRSIFPGVLLGAAAAALLLFVFVCIGVTLRDAHRAPVSTGATLIAPALPSRVEALDIPPVRPEPGPAPAVPATGTSAGLDTAPPTASTAPTAQPAHPEAASPPPSRKIEREL